MEDRTVGGAYRNYVHEGKNWKQRVEKELHEDSGWDFLHHPKSNAKRIRNMSLDQVSRELNKTQTRVKKRNLHLDTELGRIRAAATSSYPASPTNNSSFQPESHSVRYREPVVLAQTHSYDARAGSKKQVGSRAWLKQHPVAMTQLSVATTKPEKLFIPAVPGPGYMAGSSSQPFSSTRSQYRPSKPMPRHSAYYPRVRSPSASELLHMTTATSNSPLARGRSPSPTYHLSPLAPLTPELRGVEESKIESGGGRGATPLGGLTQRTADDIRPRKIDINGGSYVNSGLDPNLKYKQPVTTNQSIGWSYPKKPGCILDLKFCRG